jgi:hypothetical protein
VLRANIRRYERVLADPETLPMTREVVAELLAQTRKALETLWLDEVQHATVKTLR